MQKEQRLVYNQQIQESSLIIENESDKTRDLDKQKKKSINDGYMLNNK